MKRLEQYRNYIQNEGLDSIPSNRKLRINSEPEHLSAKNPPKSRQSTNLRLINKKNSNKPQYSRTSFTHELQSRRSSQKSNYHKSENQHHSQKSFIHLSPPHKSQLTNIEIPYDTEEITKNVSKVLSSIEEIESEFRKVSNNNSLAMKEPFINSFQNPNQQSPSFIQELMKKIKQPVNYEQKPTQYIQKQKFQLVKLIKNLNQRLNHQLKQCQDAKEKTVRKSANESMAQKRRRIKTDLDENESDRKNSRTSSALEFEKSLVQTLEQINNNQKLIDNMRNELEFLNKKYEQYQQSLKNYHFIQNSITQLRELIKKKKQQISRVRKNKFLNQKAIISIEKRNGNVFASDPKDILSTNCSTNMHSCDILASLKDQFSQLVKKKEKIKEKIELTKMHLNKIQELKQKNHVNKQHYDQLAQQVKRLELNEYGLEETDPKAKPRPTSLCKPSAKLAESNIKTAEHINFIYKTKKSRLQMLLNTIKRTEDGLKQKYFGLLKEYEAMVDLTQNDSASPSPTKSKNPLKAPIIKIYKEHEKIIDDKLDKSKDQIQQLQRIIQRIGKVGKISKVNQQIQPTTKNPHFQSQNQSDNLQYEQDFDQLQDRTSKLGTAIDSMVAKPRIRSKQITAELFQNRSHIQFSNGHTPSSINNRTQKSHSLGRMHSGGISEMQTPPYSNNGPSSETEQNRKFMTEDDHSFVSDLSSVLDKSLIRYERSHAQDNRNNRKYIGKFKKQRILQKSALTSQSQSMQDSLALKYQGQAYPIIEQQIEGTSEQDTSGVLNKSSLSSGQNYYQISKQGGYSSPLQDQYSYSMNSPIEEELEWEAEGSEIRRENTSELEREVEAERQMDLIEKEVQKQQKEEEIKEKFAKILFKNSLFYSS